VSALADRLRGIVRALPPVGESHEQTPPSSSDAAATLGGQWRELRGQQFLVIDRKFSPGHRHGHVAVADTLPPHDGSWPRFPLLNNAAASSPRDGRMLFVDLETTGLAGGAGTYAFLVGCAWYQDGGLRVRQFFLSDFGAERVLLEAVGEVAAQCGAIVTFNGKSFDLPLIETRFLMHRLQTPFTGIPHVDMLHPARRLWRQDEGNDPGCRLTALEQTLCGFVREGDVPGFEIPSRYFHYVRTGDARCLAAVMEHNRLDLVSLAMLTARAAQLLGDGPASAHTAREALGLGRLYERAGMIAEACAAYDRAAEHRDADVATRADAWRSYAVLSRRVRRFGEAASAWRRILSLRGCPPAIARDASEALAVHHEHRLRDLQAARHFALQSLSAPATPSRREATQHRLARLDRKLGDAGAVSVPLF
jgi:uncharacterized protein YprB with RNaseH-like and TPR domain